MTTVMSSKRVTRKPGQLWRSNDDSNWGFPKGSVWKIIERRDSYWGDRPDWVMEQVHGTRRRRNRNTATISGRALTTSGGKWTFIGDETTEPRPWTIICGNCGAGRVVVAAAPASGRCPYCHG